MAEREDPLRWLGIVSLIVLGLLLVESLVERRDHRTPSTSVESAQQARVPEERPPLPEPIPKGEVMFNTNSRKYHCLSCRSVARCSNCVLVFRREAKERGGIACGNCGGCD